MVARKRRAAKGGRPAMDPAQKAFARLQRVAETFPGKIVITAVIGGKVIRVSSEMTWSEIIGLLSVAKTLAEHQLVAQVFPTPQEYMGPI